MEKKTLVSYLETFARHGARTALVYKTGYRTLKTSYQELFELASRVSVQLDREGLKKGDRVILWGTNSPDWVAVFFGCLLKGLIAVPLDARGNAAFTARIFEFTRASLLVHDLMHPPPAGIKTAMDFAALIKKARGLPATPFSPAAAEPSDIAEILFTSGTTAEPKGVMLTHENITANLSALRAYITEFKNDERLLSLLPLSHIFEQTVGLWLPLSHGASVTYLKGLTASSIFQAIEEDGITLAAIVPRLLGLLKNGILREVQRKKKEKIFDLMLSLADCLPAGMRRSLFPELSRRFGKFKFFAVGGATLEPELERFWERIGVPLVQGYGLTETSPVITYNRPKARRAGSIGKVLPGLEVRLGPENEIQVRGKNVFVGYYRDPKRTEEAFQEDWFKTGDLGAFDPDGFLFFRGREKDLIVTDEGLNVYPEDLEAVLHATPGVKDCCVVDMKKGERTLIHAALILETPAVDPKNAIDRANGQLADYQKIQSFSVWPGEDFPRTSTMKIKKNEVLAILRKKETPGPGTGTPEQPADPLYQMLARLAQMPLGSVHPQSRLGDDLGLSSLDRVELAAMIAEEFHVDIDETLLGAAVRVEALSDFLRSRPPVHEPTIPKWPVRPWARTLRVPLQDLFFFPLVRSYCQINTEGLENLENLPQPAIFVGNHTSYFDGPVVLMALPRAIRKRIAPATWRGFFESQGFHPLFWLWKRVMFYLASLGFNIYLFDPFTGIKKSIEHTGWLLDRGFDILLFPEAERTLTGHMGPFKTGIGMMAEILNVPVIPVGIHGLFEIFPPQKALPRRGKVTVRFGKPVFHAGETREVFVNKLRNEVQRLSS